MDVLLAEDDRFLVVVVGVVRLLVVVFVDDGVLVLVLVVATLDGLRLFDRVVFFCFLEPWVNSLYASTANTMLARRRNPPTAIRIHGFPMSVILPIIDTLNRQIAAIHAESNPLRNFLITASPSNIGLAEPVQPWP